MARAKILLVDDDRLFREAYSEVLAAQGHDVTTAEDGQDALDKYKPATFDVALVDLVMPRLDGLSLIQALRHRDPDQEVVIVTQKDDVRAAVAALRAGASDYLLKPVEREELLHCVARSFERAQLKRERARLLDENLEFVKHQVLYQRCLELLSTLDLERLQETSLSYVCSVCDAQSGAIWLADDRGDLHLRAYRGLIDRQTLFARVDPRTPPFSDHLQARVPFDPPNLPRGKGFYLPLWASGERVGMVLCTDKLTGDFNEQDKAVGRAVGDFAATALRNARRYAAVERVGLKDRDSSAYNLSYFVDYASKEFYKSRRYGRVFSMLTVSIDHYEQLKRQRGAEDAKAYGRAVTACLGRLVRDSDVIAKAAEGEFYLLLPETDHLGALMFARRAQEGIARDPTVQQLRLDSPVSVVMGAATFPRDGEDFDELLHVCRTRMDETRKSLARKLGIEALDFWSAVDLLLGTRESPPLPPDDSAGPSRRGYLPPGLFAQVQTELALDIARDPRARGLLYIGATELRDDLPAVHALEGLPADTAMRVYLLGRRGDLGAHGHATPVFLDGDDRIAKHEFLLLFSENVSYALVQRRPPRGAPWGFHTSDAALVDELVSKLQSRYDLQPF